MAAKKTTRAPSGEWVGGIVTMLAKVKGEGPPYVPEALFWLTAEGFVVGTTAGRSGEVARRAGAALEEAMRRPLFGVPSAPTRVRVATAELAATVAEDHPGLEVIVAPTPEIDAVAESMWRRMAEDASAHASYLTGGIEADAMAALFRAAAALYRAKPWKVVPDDQCLLYATCEAFAMRDAPISIVGQAGETFGFITFADVEAFDAFIEAAEISDFGVQPMVEPHLALTFEKRKEMPPEMVREITTHGWETAGPSAMPLLGPTGKLGPRPPEPDDVARLEVLSLALVEALRDSRALLAAWDLGDPWSGAFRVASHGGEVAITLSAARIVTNEAEAIPHSVLADLNGLARTGFDMEHDERRELEAELLREFLRSPEAVAVEITEPAWLACVMDLAATQLGETVATLSSADLAEVVFELIPRKVVVEASAGDEIVDELRAFYAFLGRAYRLEQAASCLRVLGPDAGSKLRAALSNTTKFGMGKALLVGRAAAGSAPSPAVAKGAKKTAKKDDRKAARRARRKNR